MALDEIYGVIDKIVAKMENEKNDESIDEKTVVKRSLLQSLILSRREAKESGSKVPFMPIDQIKGNIIHVMIAGYGTQTICFVPATHLCPI